MLADVGSTEEAKISSEQMAFAIFCIENLAKRLKMSAPQVYHKLADDSNILYQYIIPCYDILHTQDKEYILDDIEDVMQSEGVLI